MEVVFDGCQPEPRTVESCIEMARTLGTPARQVESCEVLVTDWGPSREIRIDIRTAQREVVVDRFTSSREETELRSALRQARVIGE